MPKDLFDYPLKEIEGAFNTEMWKAKAGVRMKYKGEVKGFAKFEIRPMETIGIVISDFDLDYSIKDIVVNIKYIDIYIKYVDNIYR